MRICKRLASLTLALALCAGGVCGALADGEGLYAGLTDIDPADTLLEVDGNPCPAEIYFYWNNYNASSLENELMMYNAYYGLYGDLFGEDGRLLWDAELAEGVTARQFLDAQTRSTVLFYTTVENLADELGIELNDEDLAGMEADFQEAAEQAGGEEELLETMDQMGLSRESFDRISADMYKVDHMVALAEDPDSPLYMTEEQLDESAVYADHILLANTDQETGEALSEEALDSQRDLAQDLLDQLQAAEEDELEALFTQLAEEYGQDPGRAANNGYVYSPGTMVAAFEDAAAALEPGQISGIVESTYGLHIILRKDLQAGLEGDPDQKAQMLRDHVFDVLQERMDNAQVKDAPALADFDSAAFYQACTDRIIAQSHADEAGAAEEADEEPGETDGDAGEPTDAGAAE